MPRSMFILTTGILLVWSTGAFTADDTSEVLKLLKAKDFWDKTGKSGSREWSKDEHIQLELLKKTSEDPVIRLRANKVLVDLAKRGRSDGDEEMLIGCFRFLEKEMANNPVIKYYCAEGGFTDYFSSTQKKWLFFIERHPKEKDGVRGGVNLFWNSESKTAIFLKSWGSKIPVD